MTDLDKRTALIQRITRWFTGGHRQKTKFHDLLDYLAGIRPMDEGIASQLEERIREYRQSKRVLVEKERRHA